MDSGRATEETHVKISFGICSRIFWNIHEYTDIFWNIHVEYILEYSQNIAAVGAGVARR